MRTKKRAFTRPISAELFAITALVLVGWPLWKRFAHREPVVA